MTKTYACFSVKPLGFFNMNLQHAKAYEGPKPTVFDDLIAMNALYRPGPMEYIPSFIRRKHGEEEIEYDLPAMEEYLKETAVLQSIKSKSVVISKIS